MKSKTYYIRVRAEYTVYTPVEESSLELAESKAKQILFDGMNDEFDAIVDFEEYDPNDFT